MNIFSEIYGAYFRTAAALLSQRGKPLSETDFYKAVERHGFRDSALFLPRKLIPQKDDSDWGKRICTFNEKSASGYSLGAAKIVVQSSAFRSKIRIVFQ